MNFIEQAVEQKFSVDGDKLQLPGFVKRIKIDVGCSNGQLIASWLERDDQLFVIGIEPNPHSISDARSRLNNLFGHRQNWLLFEGGIGPEAGTTDLFVPKQSRDLGSLLKHTSHSEGSQILRVEVERLDTILAMILDSGFEKVDFLKTDCQGYDLEVLKSGGELLAKVAVITSEADSDGYAGASNSVEAIESYLSPLGFKWVNSRSRWRRKLGGILAQFPKVAQLGIRLPVLVSREVSGQSAQIDTEDPTFVNSSFADRVRVGEITAFQKG